MSDILAALQGLSQMEDPLVALEEVTRLREGSWERKGACRGVDPEFFYPERGGSTREAKAVCRRCEVYMDCALTALLGSEKFGIWGGMSERERRRIRKKYREWCGQKGVVRVSISRPSTVVGSKQKKVAVVAAANPSEDEEDTPLSEREFQDKLSQVQLDLVRHVLRYGSSGLLLRSGELNELARMLGIGEEALQSQRLGPLVQGGLVGQRETSEGILLEVTDLGNNWFRNSGMKPLPSLHSPTTQKKQGLPPERFAEICRKLASQRPPDGAKQPPGPSKKGVTGMAVAPDTYEDLSDADLEILTALSKKPFVDDSGRATGLLAAATGLANTWQNARLRLLVEAGLVNREVNGKRTKSIQITEVGREWLARAVDPAPTVVAQAGGAAPAALSATSSPAPGSSGVPAAQRSANGDSVDDALANLQAAIEADRRQLLERVGQLENELAESNEQLEAVTTERDRLLAADHARQKKIADLQAQRKRLEEEEAALGS